MSELPIKGTFKAGTGYDAPWLTIDAATPDDFAFKVKAMKDHPEAIQAAVELANMFKAVNNAAPVLPGNAAPQQQAPVQQAAPSPDGPPPAWAATPAPQQQAAPPQQQYNAPPAAAPGPTLHPEGKRCSCGQVLQYKVVERKRDNKVFNFWACPNQRSQNDGHTSEFAN